MVLAAGAARRFGRPKQLERWPTPESPTLVERAVGLAAECGIWPVWVVTGNRGAEVQSLLEAGDWAGPVYAVYNPRWEEGQGFSVGAGVRAVQAANPEAGGILFMLADQPRLKAETLGSLARYFAQLGSAGEQAIIFPTFQGKRGNPAIFGRAYFEELAGLEGDVGGRAIVRKYPQAIVEVPVEDPAIHEDVDTPEALGELSP